MQNQDEILLIREYLSNLPKSQRTPKQVIAEMEKTLEYQDDLTNETKTLLENCIALLEKKGANTL